jgi:hypothetical protein
MYVYMYIRVHRYVYIYICICIYIYIYICKYSKTAVFSSRGDNDAEKEVQKMDVFKQSEALPSRNTIDGKYRDVYVYICRYVCSCIIVSLLVIMQVVLNLHL